MQDFDLQWSIAICAKHKAIKTPAVARYTQNLSSVYRAELDTRACSVRTLLWKCESFSNNDSAPFGADLLTETSRLSGFCSYTAVRFGSIKKGARDTKERGRERTKIGLFSANTLSYSVAPSDWPA